MVDDEKLKGTEGVEGSGSGKDRGCYALTGGDHPGLLITHVQLRGENYDEWALAIGMALRAKKKLGFVMGTIEQPAPNSLDIEDWWMMNSMLVSWMFNTFESTLRSTITYVDSAKALWDDLQQRFSVGNGLRVQQLKAELANHKQRGIDVVTFYGRMKKLWDDLGNYDRIPICNCTGCTCNLTALLVKRQEEERVHQFVMGLDDSMFGTVCSNILAMEPLPNLNQVYSMMIREERHRNIARSRDVREEAVSFAVRSFRPRGETRDKSSLTCTQCDRTGHLKEECFEIIGYPEWWGIDQEGDLEEEQAVVAAVGMMEGVDELLPRQQGADVACAAQGLERNGAATDRTVVPNLTQEQWTAMINLLDKTHSEHMTGKKLETTWLLDTGASHHMSGHIDGMTNLRDIVPWAIRLPDGEHTTATKEGHVVLRDNMLLRNVLYVPKLRCNLISVSQLTDDWKCFGSLVTQGN